VSLGNRKVCSRCGADVTFAKRIRDEHGSIFCNDCAQILPASEVLSLPKTLSEVQEPHGDGPTQPADSMSGLSAAVIAHAPKRSAPPKKKKAEWSPTKWIVALCLFVIAAIVTGGYLVTRPTWEDLNGQRITDMKGEADVMKEQQRPKDAYFKYKELFDFVGDHKITGPSLAATVADARNSMDQEYALASVLIEKEVADAKAKVEAEQRAEAARKAAQEAQAALAGKQRREAEMAAAEKARQAIALANERAQSMAGAARFRNSAEYAALRAHADRIVSSLDTSLITEDSAYRSIQERSEAARELLVIYVKIQGSIHGTDVTADADRISAKTDRAMIGEDSAIRAIDAEDQGFFDLLGVWCAAEISTHPELSRSFDAASSSVRLFQAGDDSAVRSISDYTGASMLVLKALATSQGHASEAAAIVSSVDLLNAGDDSAWRVAMRHSEANMKLILTLFPRDQAAAASRISTSVSINADTDDSAVRAQSQYLQGIVDGLHVLIENQ
jgi:hypothetical protein